MKGFYFCFVVTSYNKVPFVELVKLKNEQNYSICLYIMLIYTIVHW